MIQTATVPEGVPTLPYPLNLRGYELVPGRKYHRLAQVDRVEADGKGAGHSVLVFVEFNSEFGDVVIYKADGWKKCGRLLGSADTAHWMPYVLAAKAALDGTGPATFCAPRDVELLGRYGNHGHRALPEGWVRGEVTRFNLLRHVTRYTHPSGAIIDDNTFNVPEGLSEAEAADTAYVGHQAAPSVLWEQFPTFAEASAFALGSEVATAS